MTVVRVVFCSRSVAAVFIVRWRGIVWGWMWRDDIMIISNNKDERTSERQNARETNAIQGASARTRTAVANLLEIRGEQQRRRQKAPPPLPCRRHRRRSSAIAQLAQQPLRCASPPPPPPMTIIAFLFAIV